MNCYNISQRLRTKMDTNKQDDDIEETLPPNVIRIETQDGSGDFIEIILPEENPAKVSITDKIKSILFSIFRFFKISQRTKNIDDFTKKQEND